MQGSRRIIHQLDPNPIRFFDHMTVGDDESLRIYDYSRTQRTFSHATAIRKSGHCASRPLTALAARSEETIKEIFKRIIVVIITLTLPALTTGSAHASSRALDR